MWPISYTFSRFNYFRRKKKRYEWIIFAFRYSFHATHVSLITHLATFTTFGVVSSLSISGQFKLWMKNEWMNDWTEQIQVNWYLPYDFQFHNASQQIPYTLALCKNSGSVDIFTANAPIKYLFEFLYVHLSIPLKSYIYNTQHHTFLFSSYHSKVREQTNRTNGKI